MAKMLLMTVIVAMTGIPILCASDSSPRRGLQRAVLLVVAYNVFYLFAIRFIYPYLL